MELEFRSGVSLEGRYLVPKHGKHFTHLIWSAREFLDPDELGELLDGPCYNPKVLEWKREEVGATADNTAWCFKPYRRTLWEHSLRHGWTKRELLVCGHERNCDGQQELL